MEITTHTVISKDEKVSILLEGLHKKDAYGTNLELTGQGNWFGSLNICNMLGDNCHELFAPINVDMVDSEKFSQCSLLELGSGLGRAGLMAVKLIELEAKRFAKKQATKTSENTTKQDDKTLLPRWNCVLTDGEEEIMDLLHNNCHLNFPTTQTNTKTSAHDNQTTEISTTITPATVTSCQQLWWGENAELQTLRERFPQGFDVIIGADLIYGRDKVVSLPDIEAEEEVQDRAHEGIDGVAEGVQGVHVSSVQGGGGAEVKAEEGFGRDKLRLVMHTVGALLSHRGSSTSGSSTIPTTSDITNTSITTNTTPTTIPTTTTPPPSTLLTPLTPTSSDFDIHITPAFYLAITRRELLPMEEMRKEAFSAGLQVRLLEDYTFDIFDTNVDSESMFWRDTILLFTRV